MLELRAVFLLKQGTALVVLAVTSFSQLELLLWAPVVAASRLLPVEPALALVQEGRRMAQPNSNFMEQLLAFERDGVFRRLRDELAE